MAFFDEFLVLSPQSRIQNKGPLKISLGFRDFALLLQSECGLAIGILGFRTQRLWVLRRQDSTWETRRYISTAATVIL